MPVTKSAYLRYLCIDRCLKRKNTNYHSAVSIIEYIADKLDQEISLRTFQSDIKMMKEDEVLGFFAPIAFSRVHGGYYYSDPEFSLGRIMNLKEEDYRAMEFAAEILSAYKDNPLVEDFYEIIEKIKTDISIARTTKGKNRSIILPDKSHFVKGIEFLDELAVACRDSIAVEILYHRFNSDKSVNHLISPLFLKEYNHRWYVIGQSDKQDSLLHLALDRIKKVTYSKEKYLSSDINPENYFRDYFGVSVTAGAKPIKIRVLFDASKSNYLNTKQIHHSQKAVSQNDRGTVF
jgi:predicted DNA-binding transcriptional regulator YafY